MVVGGGVVVGKKVRKLHYNFSLQVHVHPLFANVLIFSINQTHDIFFCCCTVVATCKKFHMFVWQPTKTRD